LWHSLFADSTSWNRVSTLLAKFRQLILIDGPAHGGSGSPTEFFSLADCAGAACDVLTHLGIEEQVDWLGNAWGGHVGLMFAATFPDRCRSLVSVGAPVRALERAERRRLRAVVTIYRVAGPRPLVRAVTDALLGPEASQADPQAFAVVSEAFRRANRRGCT